MNDDNINPLSFDLIEICNLNYFNCFKKAIEETNKMVGTVLLTYIRCRGGHYYSYIKFDTSMYIKNDSELKRFISLYH